MKKLIFILSVVLCLLDVPTLYAATMWDVPRSSIQSHQLVFLRVRDEYQLRYAINGLPQGTHQVRANFWSTTGTYYDTVFDNPTGIAYLTCNGTYIFEVLDSSGQTIAETTQIKTTKISAPACKSYENSGLKNDLGIVTHTSSNGSKIVNFTEIPDDTTKIEYHHNGEYQFDADLEAPGLTLTEPGTWTIVAKDAAGNILGSTDVIVGGSDPVGGDNGSGGDGGDGSGETVGSCNGCDWIKDALACPAWDDYMGEWKSMLQEVYQPPNWQEVANIMRDTIVPAMGQELINRSPEMAKIFADEFTSREKKTQPAPTTPPAYTPPTELPQLQDMNEEIEFDLSNNIPNFEPDYSESQPFDIPNPFDLQFDDNDLGYNIQISEPDHKDYNMPQIGGDDNDMPQYNAPGDNDMPQYNAPGDNDTMPEYSTPQDNTMPDYNTPSEGVRYYEGGTS